MSETTSKREWLLLASYCGSDNPLCSSSKPCPSCLGMSNVFTFEDGEMRYERELAPEWNTSNEIPAIRTPSVPVKETI